MSGQVKDGTLLIPKAQTVFQKCLPHLKSFSPSHARFSSRVPRTITSGALLFRRRMKRLAAVSFGILNSSFHLLLFFYHSCLQFSSFLLGPFSFHTHASFPLSLSTFILHQRHLFQLAKLLSHCTFHRNCFLTGF